MLLGRRWRVPAGEGVGEVDAGALVCACIEGRAEAVQQQAHLQVRHHEGRGQDLEAEDAAQRRLLDVVRRQRVLTALMDRPGDAAQHFHGVRGRAGAGIEHVDIRVGQPVGPAKLLAQGFIHALDHVARYLGWRVPHAQLLAQFRVERLQERLVEILHRVFLLEAREEGVAVDPIQRGGGPVEHLDQSQRLKLGGRRYLLEEGTDHGYA